MSNNNLTVTYIQNENFDDEMGYSITCSIIFNSGIHSFTVKILNILEKHDIWFGLIPNDCIITDEFTPGIDNNGDIH